VAHAVRDVLLVAGAVGFVGALAQVSIHLSFTPVPITGQTLGVMLAGTALGWRPATAAMALYVIAGVAGLLPLVRWKLPASREETAGR
jgi:biotin transport system substrate-specific component